LIKSPERAGWLITRARLGSDVPRLWQPRTDGYHLLWIHKVSCRKSAQDPGRIVFGKSRLDAIKPVPVQLTSQGR
jgi:hypothetical protein